MNVRERIVFVDALRGYALMGLFLIHMVEYFELYWLHPEPGPVNTVMFALFGGKAYAIFALLFGLSFYIILSRQAARGVDFRGRFAWRVTLLLVIGYLHGLVYGGDILQVLAVAGFLILPFWRAGDRVLAVAAGLCLLQVPTFAYVTLVDALGGYVRPFFLDLSQAAYRVYAGGTFADVLAINAWQGMQFKWSFMLESGRLSNVVGLALAGCLIGRSGFIVDAERFRLAWWAGLAALVAAWWLLTWLRGPLVAALGNITTGWFAGNVVDIYRNTLLAGATVLLLALA
ncbi:MAG TPA: heparan-alpha-glucosaminide N-acetyltransferase domain-containing protein, partial [Woeseiaceae bacterium]|nr:heparan-alpha-glucosaminide N-acetyltransferase domain-containing protein [Woeseiaceae bacterium]